MGACKSKAASRQKTSSAVSASSPALVAPTQPLTQSTTRPGPSARGKPYPAWVCSVQGLGATPLASCRQVGAVSPTLVARMGCASRSPHGRPCLSRRDAPGLKPNLVLWAGLYHGTMYPICVAVGSGLPAPHAARFRQLRIVGIVSPHLCRSPGRTGRPLHRRCAAHSQSTQTRKYWWSLACPARPHTDANRRGGHRTDADSVRTCAKPATGSP
jgi:hypothetical protein